MFLNFRIKLNDLNKLEIFISDINETAELG
jgi:hypothetical protein